MVSISENVTPRAWSFMIGKKFIQFLFQVNTEVELKAVFTKFGFVVAFFFVIQTDIGIAQTGFPELNRKISISEQKQDLSILRENLESLHIGLYTYTPKPELDSVFEAVNQNLDKPATTLEFFRKLTKINKPIGNGHTGLSPPKTILDGIEKNIPIFPLETFWDGTSLFIVKNLSRNDSIKIGSKIISINGEETVSLMRRMANGIKRDGYGTSYPNRRLSKFFPLHYAVLTKIVTTFSLVIESHGNNRRIQLQALTREEMEKVRFARYSKQKIKWEDSNDSAFALAINGDVAKMKVRTFQNKLIKKKGQNWKKFFRKSFKSIRKAKVKHLVIDLRDNNGGQPAPTIELLSQMVGEPFTIFRSIRTKVAKIPNSAYLIKDGSKENFESLKWRKNGEIFESTDKSVLRLKKPAKNPYDGKIYVLTNAFSTSATGTFIGQLKSRTNAIFIGEEPGGNPNQTVARRSVGFILPNSKIKILIPLVLSIKEVNFKNTGRGVIPDYKIWPKLEDVLGKRDPVMDFTLKLIKRSRNQ